MKEKQKKLLNNLKPKLVKQVLVVPHSTPSLAIQHDFGIIDMDLNIEAETLISCANICNLCDSPGI